jgi:Protein of unknown function (DUF3180)
VTRDLPPEPEEDEERPEPGPGHVRTTGTGTLVVFGLIGLVLGWLVRPISVRLNGSAPTVGWLPVLALLLGAVILAAVAWSTYRDLHPKKPGRPPRVLEPHQAVNRLVLAKSCALAGAMVGGGYFGYALSWWRVSEASLAQQRMVQSVLAGLSGVLIVAAALWLERACRVRGEGDADLR